MEKTILQMTMSLSKEDEFKMEQKEGVISYHLIKQDLVDHGIRLFIVGDEDGNPIGALGTVNIDFADIPEVNILLDQAFQSGIIALVKAQIPVIRLSILQNMKKGD